MHAAHEAHRLIGILGGLVAHGQHACKRVIHNQIHIDLTLMTGFDRNAHLDHERRCAEHDTAGADSAGHTALDQTHVTRGEGDAEALLRGIGQHAAQLQTSGFGQRGCTAENLLIRDAAQIVDGLKLDRAGREQIVLEQHDLLRAAQQVGLTRTRNGCTRAQ